MKSGVCDMELDELKLPPLNELWKLDAVLEHRAVIREALLSVHKGYYTGRYGICHAVKQYLLGWAEEGEEAAGPSEAFDALMFGVADRLDLRSYWFCPSYYATDDVRAARVAMAGLLIEMIDCPSLSIPIPYDVAKHLLFVEED